MANRTVPLHTGIYRPSKNIGMLWKRLADGEKIAEHALGLAAALKRPHHRLEVITKHGKRPKPNQTHVWEIKREGGFASMLNLKPR
jgi:hypothetical protein